MKRVVIALVLVTAVAWTATPANAVGFHAIYWDGEDIDKGYGAGVKHKIGLLWPISVDLRASWVRFGDAELNTFPLEAVLRMKILKFYAGFGLGYYIFDQKDIKVDNAIGSFVAGGAEFAPFGLGFFAELRYHWLKTESEGVIGGAGGSTAKADLSANGLGIGLGVLWSW